MIELAETRYSYDIEISIKSLLSDPRIRYGEEVEQTLSPKNIEIIWEFLEEKKSEGVGLGAQRNYAQTLHLLGSFLWGKETKKTFHDLTKKDLRIFFSHLADNYRSSYIDSSKARVRTFLGWLGKDKLLEETKKILKRSARDQEKSITPDDLFTGREIELIISFAEHPRNRALFALIAETGARISEVCALQLRHLKPDPDGLIIHMPNAKFDTGDWANGEPNTRPLWVKEALPYIRAWLNQHPLQGEDQRAYLFCRIKGDITQPIGGRYVLKLLKQLQKRIRKKYPNVLHKTVYPHLFRHTRATELAKHLSESVMRKIFNWAKDSDMPSRYIHLSALDTIQKMKALHGVVENEKEVPRKLKTIICPDCEQENPENYKYCLYCNSILDQAEEMRNKVKRLIAKRIDSMTLDELRSFLQKK